MSRKKKSRGKTPAGNAASAESSPGPDAAPAQGRDGIIAVFSNHPAARFLAHPATLAVIAFILALGVRIHVAPFYAKGPDNFQYLALARDMARGDYFRRDFDLDAGLAMSRRVVPLYPAMIALTMKLGADPEHGGAWVSVIMGALIVFPLFGIGMRLGNKWAGAVAALFFAVFPPDLYTAGQILTEGAFGFFTAASVWSVLWFMDRPSSARMGLTGVLCALSYLTRDVGFGYIFLAEVSVAAAALALKWPRRKAAAWAAAGLAVFALCSAPYWIFIRAHTGSFGFTLRGSQGLKANVIGYEKGSRPAAEDEEEGPEERGAEHAGSGAGSIAVLPLADKMARLTGQYIEANNEGLAWTFDLLVLAGLVLFPWRDRKQWPREAVLWLWAAAVMEAYALVTPYMVDARYYQPVAMLSCVWAGRGVALLPGRAARAAGEKAGGWVFGVVLAAVLVGAGWQMKMGRDSARYTSYFYSPANMAGKTVAGNREIALDARGLLSIKPGARIISRKPYFAYYLEGRFVLIADTVEGVRKQVRDHDGDYVFIDSMSARRYTPALKELVTAADDPLPGAGLAYRRYLSTYNKLFSVYQVGANPISAPPLAEHPSEDEVNRALVRAEQYFKDGYVENARQTLLAIVAVDPANALAHRGLIKAYIIYGYYDGHSFDRAEDELMRYSYLSPDDPLIKDYQKTISMLRLQNKAQWGEK